VIVTKARPRSSPFPAEALGRQPALLDGRWTASDDAGGQPHLNRPDGSVVARPERPRTNPSLAPPHGRPVQVADQLFYDVSHCLIRDSLAAHIPPISDESGAVLDCELN